MQQAATYRLLLVASILVRTYFAFQSSYIHPDEHFQGPEPIADKIFDWATHKTWEFTVDHPPRSLFAIWTVFGVPMWLLRVVLGADADPMTVYMSLRFVFALASWVLCDMFIDRLALSRKNSVKSLFFASTSYVSWVYQSHFFTNSAETVLVLWALALIQEISVRSTLSGAPKGQFRECMLLGFLLTLGAFNRPSFVAYMIIPCLTLIRPLVQRKAAAIVILTTAVATAYCAVMFDTWAYGSSPSYVIAPLNNFIYNTNTSKLAEHGIHSRWTHMVASIPQLLGPALIYVPKSFSNIKMLPLKAAISGVLFLSLIPHQEARFLVPLVPLFCLFINPDAYSAKIRQFLVLLWIIFNAVLAILMGILHQGGVVPAQYHIGQYLKNETSPATVVYWNTYPPPVWIMGLRVGSVSYTQNSSPLESNVRTINIVDLMGSPEEDLNKVIQQSLTQNHQTLVVAPNSVSDAIGRVPGINASQLYSTKSHISMESFDWTHPRLGLTAWKIVNNQA